MDFLRQKSHFSPSFVCFSIQNKNGNKRSGLERDKMVILRIVQLYVRHIWMFFEPQRDKFHPHLDYNLLALATLLSFEAVLDVITYQTAR